MSDGIKESTLELATGDEFLDRMVRKVIKNEYEALAGAKLELFWALGRELSWWGTLKVATEELWLLSGGIDMVLHLNKALWMTLDPAGREGFLSVHLWSAEKKTGGQTVQRTAEGERQLYKKRRPTMAVAPEVIARHPALCDQLPELKQFRLAINEPEQYLLDLHAPDEADEAAAA